VRHAAVHYDEAIEKAAANTKKGTITFNALGLFPVQSTMIHEIHE